MILFAICASTPVSPDSGFSTPSCSYVVEETPKKKIRAARRLFYSQDASTQTVTVIDPKLRKIAQQLAAICDEFEREFYVEKEEFREEKSKIEDSSCLFGISLTVLSLAVVGSKWFW